MKGDRIMNTKRKIISITIAVLILTALTASFCYADEDDYRQPDMTNVTGMRFEPASPVQFEEYVDGYYDEDEVNLYYYPPYKMYKNGDALIFIKQDGSESRFEYSKKVDAFIDGKGFGVDADDISLRTDQMNNPWMRGEHIVKMTYEDLTYDVPVAVVENSIESVEYIPEKPYQLVENDDGYYRIDENGNEYFWYYRPSTQDHDIIRVTKKNGTVIDYEYDEDYEDEYSRYRNDDLNLSIYSDNFKRFNNQEEIHWVKGGDNYVSFLYAGIECRIPVEIIDSPIDSISYEPASPYVYIEDVDGYIEEDDEGEYFEYYDPEVEDGDRLTVVQNGVTKVFTYSEDDERFICGDERIKSWDVTFETNQRKKHWTVDGENEVTVRYLGRECKVSVTIEANKVLKIAYIPATPYVYKENDPDKGEWDYDYDDNRMFYYDTPGKAEGDKLIVTTDSGDKEYVFSVDENGFISSDGETIRSRDVKLNGGQYRDPWKPDKENFLTVVYSNRECKVPVVIIQEKKDNTMKVTTKQVTVKYAKLKKKNQKIKKGVGIKVSKPAGKVTYSLAKKDPKAKKKITISKAGVITVKKGLKKGNYTISVKVSAAGNATYNPASETVKVKIKVK